MTTLAPAQVPGLPGRPARVPERRLWLITFVDLVMLLLAFFVLMFSMSTVDRSRYAGLAQSYAGTFSVLGGVHETEVGAVRAPVVRRAPGDDLAYLEAVFRSTFGRTPSLSAIRFRLTAQYLILALPDNDGAKDAIREASAVLDPATQQQVFEIGGVLANLPNRVAVVALASTAAGPSAWQAARQRADAVRAALVAAGYPREVAVFAQGVNADEAGREALRRPIEIMVLPDAEHAP